MPLDDIHKQCVLYASSHDLGYIKPKKIEVTIEDDSGRKGKISCPPTLYIMLANGKCNHGYLEFFIVECKVT